MHALRRRSKAEDTSVPAFQPIFFLASSILFSCLASVQADTLSNRASPLGINLADVNYYAPAQQFIDVFKTGGSWVTENDALHGVWDTGEQSKLQLDANGWVTSLKAA